MNDVNSENPGQNWTRDWQDRDPRRYLNPITDHKDLGDRKALLCLDLTADSLENF